MLYLPAGTGHGNPGNRFPDFCVGQPILVVHMAVQPVLHCDAVCGNAHPLRIRLFQTLVLPEADKIKMRDFYDSPVCFLFLHRGSVACSSQNRDAVIQKGVHHHKQQGKFPHDQNGVRLHLPDLIQKIQCDRLHICGGDDLREWKIDHFPIALCGAKLLLLPTRMGMIGKVDNHGHSSGRPSCRSPFLYPYLGDAASLLQLILSCVTCTSKL